MDACNLGALGTPDNVSLSRSLSHSLTHSLTPHPPPHWVDAPNFGLAGGVLCPGAVWYQLCVCRQRTGCVTCVSTRPVD